MSKICYDGRIFLSKKELLQRLKDKNLIPDDWTEDTPLPQDPDKKLIFVSVLKSHVIASTAYKNFSLNSAKPWEAYMNYSEMCEAVREGKRCTRPTWRDGEWVFSNGKILIHTTPYWTGENLNQELNGYPYVVEQVDVVATDWRVCA
jgi:hypothetical protein